MGVQAVTTRVWAAGRVLHAGLKVEVQGFGLFSHLRPDLLFRLCVNNECIY